MVFSTPGNLSMEDYATIEGAVMETVRGRWFLMEFARRQREAELISLRAILQRVEAKLDGSTMPAPIPMRLAAVAKPQPLRLSALDALPIGEKLALFA